MRLDRNDPDHARLEERLEREVVIWLVTVSPDGRPHPSPVWFLWDGDGFLVYSQPQAAKIPNIQANPRVALHLRGTETGDDIAIFEGSAELADDVERAHRIPAYLEKYREHIAGYGWSPEGFAGDYSRPIRVNPERLRMW
jgi:PPOX class probable F420-dependent enzyme